MGDQRPSGCSYLTWVHDVYIIPDVKSYPTQQAVTRRRQRGGARSDVSSAYLELFVRQLLDDRKAGYWCQVIVDLTRDMVLGFVQV